MQLFTKEMNEEEMHAFAARLAPLLRSGDCLAFFGDLGAGKTSFIRAVIRAMTGVEEVPSPTYTLLQQYPATIQGQGVTLWHFDLYRLKKPDELYELGFEDAFTGGMAFIEWPERAKALLPARYLTLHFATGAAYGTRILTIEGGQVWAERLRPLW